MLSMIKAKPVIASVRPLKTSTKSLEFSLDNKSNGGYNTGWDVSPERQHLTIAGANNSTPMYFRSLVKRLHLMSIGTTQGKLVDDSISCYQHEENGNPFQCIKRVDQKTYDMYWYRKMKAQYYYANHKWVTKEEMPG